MSAQPLINSLINHHFCIRTSNSEDVLGRLNISFSEPIVFDRYFDWDFLFDEKIEGVKKRFLLFESLNEWTYLRWNVWDFEENFKMAMQLSYGLNTQVFYFFIDPWIFTCRWILTEKGKLIRAFEESHGKIIHEEGNFELENTIRNKIKNEQGDDEFWEDKYWELNKQVCQPIDVLSGKNELKTIRGELK